MSERTSRAMEQFPRFLAILVLYRMRAADSPAWQSLQEIFANDARARSAVTLMVCDNSPDYHPMPTQGLCEYYTRDPKNPGLAKHYNHGFRIARKRAIPWLILLDQDTTLDRSWLAELMQSESDPQLEPAIAALAPKLVEAGKVQSPHLPPGSRGDLQLPLETYGLASERIHVYNSGCTLRVSALQAIGGFPEQFPLDYLDHATFHLLQAKGGKVFVLNATLKHRLSENDSNAGTSIAYRGRLKRVREAEHAFYRTYGTPRDRLLCSRRFFHRAGAALLSGDFSRCFQSIHLALRP